MLAKQHVFFCRVRALCTLCRANLAFEEWLETIQREQWMSWMILNI